MYLTLDLLYVWLGFETEKIAENYNLQWCNNKENPKVRTENESVWFEDAKIEISEWESTRRIGWGDHVEDVNIPGLQLKMKQRGKPIADCIIEGENILILRDMLSSYLNSFEMRKKIDPNL